MNEDILSVAHLWSEMPAHVRSYLERGGSDDERHAAWVASFRPAGTGQNWRKLRYIGDYGLGQRDAARDAVRDAVNEACEIQPRAEFIRRAVESARRWEEIAEQEAPYKAHGL